MTSKHVVSFIRPRNMSTFQCGEALFLHGAIDSVLAMRMAKTGRGTFGEFASETKADDVVSMLRCIGIDAWSNEVRTGDPWIGNPV